MFMLRMPRRCIVGAYSSYYCFCLHDHLRVAYSLPDTNCNSIGMPGGVLCCVHVHVRVLVVHMPEM